MTVFILFFLMSNSPRQAHFQQEFKTLEECRKGAQALAELGKRDGLVFQESLCMGIRK
jgi:hypothetical protein